MPEAVDEMGASSNRRKSSEQIQVDFLITFYV